MVSIDPERVVDLVRRLDFPRAVGNEGEQRGFEIIREDLMGLGIDAEFECFTSPWVEFTEAYLEIKGERLPIRPLVSPIYDFDWLRIPRTMDVEGTLISEADATEGHGDQILLRTSCDIEQPCMPSASAQLFACTPEEPFVAYLLAFENPVPSAYVDEKQKEFLTRSVGQTCRFHWDSRDCEKTLKNMAAEIRGSEKPEEVIVVGAHIDSFPGTAGASDDACGCAILVELAAHFVRNHPRRTVRFVWFTGEELDCRGSKAYVAEHLRDEGRIVVYVNIDSGFAFEHGSPYVGVSDVPALVERVGALIAKMGKDIRIEARERAYADAASFAEHGIPIVWCCASYKKPSPHPHLPTDTFDTIDPEKVRLIGEVSGAVVEAAQARDFFG
jgi:hypothetical protein